MNMYRALPWQWRAPPPGARRRPPPWQAWSLLGSDTPRVRVHRYECIVSEKCEVQSAKCKVQRREVISLVASSSSGAKL